MKKSPLEEAIEKGLEQDPQEMARKMIEEEVQNGIKEILQEIVENMLRKDDTEQGPIGAER